MPIDKIKGSLKIHKGKIRFLLKFSSLLYQLKHCEYCLHCRPSCHEASLLNVGHTSRYDQEGHTEKPPGQREDCNATIVGADSATAFPFQKRQNDPKDPTRQSFGILTVRNTMEKSTWSQKGLTAPPYFSSSSGIPDSRGSVVFHPFQRFL